MSGLTGTSPPPAKIQVAVRPCQIRPSRDCESTSAAFSPTPQSKSSASGFTTTTPYGSRRGEGEPRRREVTSHDAFAAHLFFSLRYNPAGHEVHTSTDDFFLSSLSPRCQGTECAGAESDAMGSQQEEDDSRVEDWIVHRSENNFKRALGSTRVDGLQTVNGENAGIIDASCGQL
uniref:Uncharacterized protein n=1 Tax=Leersia perrieri TaxID=77586 RepID=A0A0D9W9P3_9ORYZ